MQNFVVKCTDGFSKQVTAETKDAAVDMLMQDAEMQEHVKANHADLATKTLEEMKAMLASMVSPMDATQPMGQPAAPAMGGEQPAPAQPAMGTQPTDGQNNQ